MSVTRLPPVSGSPLSEGDPISPILESGRPKRGSPARPSIYDVAAIAGVSHMTVSRVLNGHQSIRESTRSRVEEAIRASGYRRSSVARALATRRTMRIGLVVNAPTQHGPRSTALAIERSARDLGYSVCSYSAPDGQEADLDLALADLLTQSVEGLCVVGPYAASLSTIRRHTSDLPVVAVGSLSPLADMLSVSVDQYRGAQLAMEHLLHLGHTAILHLAGPLDTTDARAREAAWRAAMDGGQAPRVECLEGDWTSDFGYRVGASYPGIQDFSAVFAANDQMALGLIHGLWSRGIRVPDDISVVGFDDIPDAGHFLPPLTSVRQNFDALGALVMDTLVGAIAGRECPAIQLLDADLVRRSSTSAHRRQPREDP